MQVGVVTSGTDSPVAVFGGAAGLIVLSICVTSASPFVVHASTPQSSLNPKRRRNATQPAADRPRSAPHHWTVRHTSLIYSRLS